MLEMKVIGVPQARAALETFSKSVAYKITRNAVSAGAGILKEEAGRRVTQDTGQLRKSLGVKLVGGKRGVTAIVGARKRFKRAVRFTKKGKIIGIGKQKAAALEAGGVKLRFQSPSRYAHLVEKGTKAHVVRAKNAKVLARSGTIFGKQVTVSARPKPFLEPTVRSRGPAAIAKHNKKMADGIEQERKKALAKSVRT